MTNEQAIVAAAIEFVAARRAVAIDLRTKKAVERAIRAVDRLHTLVDAFAVERAVQAVDHLQALVIAYEQEAINGTP